MLVAEIGALDFLVAADRGGHAGGDDAAIDQNRDAVGEREHRFHVVLDQHDGDFLPQLLQQRHHARRFGDAEAGHRLVQQQQLRLGGERHRQLQLALLAMAQFRHRRHRRARSSPTRASAACAASRRCFSLRALPQKRNEWPSWACAASATLSSAVKSGSSEVIWNERASPSRAAPIGRQPGDVPAGEMNGAGIRLQLPGQLADQRGLAGAVGADDGVQFARRDVERQIVGRDDAAEPPDQVFDAEQGLSHGAASRAGP